MEQGLIYSGLVPTTERIHSLFSSPIPWFTIAYGGTLPEQSLGVDRPRSSPYEWCTRSMVKKWIKTPKRRLMTCAWKRARECGREIYCIQPFLNKACHCWKPHQRIGEIRFVFWKPIYFDQYQVGVFSARIPPGGFWKRQTIPSYIYRQCWRCGWRLGVYSPMSYNDYGLRTQDTPESWDLLCDHHS